MRYNLLVSLRNKNYGYGWEVAPEVSYPLGGHSFPYVLTSGSPRRTDEYNKKIPKEYA